MLLRAVLMTACITLADADRSGNLRRKRITFEVPDEARRSLSRTEFMLLNDEQELEDLWTRAMKAADEKEAKILDERYLQLASMSMPTTTATSSPAAPSVVTTAPGATSAPATVPSAPTVSTTAPAATTTAPAAGTSAPVVAPVIGGTTAPAVVTNAPAGGTTAPASGTTAPASGTTAPAGGTTAPASGTTAPAGGTTAPAGGTTAPAGADCLGGTTRDDYILKQLSAVTDATLLQNPASPQGMAIGWITLDDPLKVDPCVYPTLEQRYGLATIYYATAGAGWTTKTDWLGGTSECQWFGITCDDANVTVSRIQLRKSLGAFAKRQIVCFCTSI